MNSLRNLEESMGCNTIRDDHGGGVIYQRVHMDKAEFDEMIRKVEEEYSDLQDENARLRSCLSDDAENARQIMGENAKLREQMERLVTLLRVDCDIDASWDGLRHFWTIGLTENGCLIRDSACKAEAENAKLRELVRDMMRAWWACDNEVCPRHDERCEKGKYCAFDECAQELGIEVEE